MTVRGNGAPYTHGNRQFKCLDGLSVYDFNWWKDFGGVMTFQNYEFTQPPIVHRPTPNFSIQAMWMEEKLKLDPTNAGLKHHLTRW